MITFAVLLFGFFALTTQTSTYEDVQLRRVIRSPHYGGYYHGPPPFFPPPPPPFIYHTHNWSGVGRGNDGSVRGVFSGAAATAENTVPNVNGAFSLAQAGATSSADCDDNSHSGGIKSTGQYTSKFSQSSSQQLGSGSIGQGILTDANTASSQFSQNSASSGLGQQSTGGYGSQSHNYNSGLGTHSGVYEDYKGNFKDTHFFEHNGRGNEYGAQASNSENTQGSSDNQVKDSSTGYNRNNEAFTQGSTQQSSSSSGTITGSYGNKQSSSSGPYFDSSGNTEVVSPGFVQHSSSDSHVNSGVSSHGQIQRGSYNFEPNQEVYGGSGHATFDGFGKYQTQHQISSGIDKFDASSQKLTQSESSGFESNLENGGGHSGYDGFGKHEGQSSSYGSNGNFGAFSQGSAQSGSSSFGSVNSGQSYGRGLGSSKLHAGDSETLKTQPLESGSEHFGQNEAGLDGGQTSGNNANGATEYGQQQSTIHGALELAAQGLQAADKAKCSTCQKSSYALSNAKSYNGAAIALSIGG